MHPNKAQDRQNCFATGFSAIAGLHSVRGGHRRMESVRQVGHSPEVHQLPGYCCGVSPCGLIRPDRIATSVKGQALRIAAFTTSYLAYLTVFVRFNKEDQLFDLLSMGMATVYIQMVRLLMVVRMLLNQSANVIQACQH
jgi:hypothetical protein